MQVDIGTTDAVTIMEWAKTNGTWQHYAEVGSTQYVNGVAGSFDNVMWTYTDSTITNGNFAGDAEDLSAWTRALSASEVAAKFNEQAEYRGFTYTNSAGMRTLGTPPQAMVDGTNTLVFSDSLSVDGYATGDEIAEFRDRITGEVGTAYYGPTHTTVDGVPCWNFNGLHPTASCFAMGSDSMLALTSLTNVTVSMWLNLDAHLKNQGVLGVNDIAFSGIRMKCGANNSPYKLISFSYQGNTGGTGSTIMGDWGATLGQWHHIASRWNSDGYVDIWLDGSLIASNTPPNTADGTLHWNSKYPVVGSWYNVGGRGVDGKISNIQFWDAFWDTSSIIKASQSPFVYPAQIPETGLKVWYSCLKDDEKSSVVGGHEMTYEGGVTNE